MREVTIRELKAISVAGLSFIKDICLKNNLKYYLGYGTLLGAVRHKGFIPWDDDIDIWMPRRDYNCFIDYVASHVDSQWEIQSNRINKDYLMPWAKLTNKETSIIPSRFINGFLYGISIDIFPIDAIDTSDIHEAELIIKKLSLKYDNLILKYHIGNSMSPIKRFMKRSWFEVRNYFCSYQRLLEQYEDALSKLTLDNDGTVCVACQTPVKCCFEKEWFGDGCKVVFEKEEFCAPTNWHEVLKVCYGDYMQLPPVEQRVTHHSFIAVYKEN